MTAELVLDASVSLAWFLKETPERAAYAAAVNAVAAEGAILHVPVQWGVEMGHVLLREHRRGVLSAKSCWRPSRILIASAFLSRFSLPAFNLPRR
jgi:hypothetical protein